ncbi:hypothetical protein K493DRAFT_313544 [Basidiobolus meristosporus CBS 931.73]|uniref:Proteasome assembly chaperone 4 n=1 Tax=Basidiobolus meristosporus CBS 931.73 TaxID=1314790 RepID=A0A1Y1YLS5_9FUNG|nr:hypothetical protein K493DRAFT_320766 [Basidiobolus meristosporus CBS 931.73]ORX98716.1 hypothetical protein K493DRAFT_313544 [Basidiobolus meristosporus CBS 931.73]|eukprot:ORX81068.1 hypothetical protein K493DRAFT_320766 [Basidiobolus meristosporus CBS 931.73]
MSSEAASPKFKVHQFSTLYLNEPIYFQVILLEDSVFVWMGNVLTLEALAVAMPPRNQSFNVNATNLLGNSPTDVDTNFAKRLASKFKRQFFVSSQLPSDPEHQVFAEREVFRKLKELLEQ